MHNYDYFLYKRFVNSAKERRHSQKWFKKQCSYLGSDYELLDEYKGLQTPVTFYHKVCGHRWQVTPDAIVYKRSRCGYCRSHRGMPRLQKFCKQREIEILSEWKLNHGIMTFKSMKCGHIFTRRVGYLYKNWNCPYCNGYRQREEISELGKKILNWRKRHGIAQTELAKMMHISPKHISELERGYRQSTKEDESLFSYYMDALDR